VNPEQSVKTDERTVAVLYASNTWGLNLIVFALLADIMYRSAVLHEAPWDLFVLLGGSGAISMLYLARHRVLGQVFGWKAVILMALAALIAAVVSAMLVVTKAMT
jgi:hypothetical protein